MILETQCKKCGGVFDGASVTQCAICSAPVVAQGHLFAGGEVLAVAEPLFDVELCEDAGHE